WWTLAWAVTVRPTISVIVAMLSTAVIQRRARRVIVTSLIGVASRGPGPPVLRGRGRGGWVAHRSRGRAARARPSDAAQQCRPVPPLPLRHHPGRTSWA